MIIENYKKIINGHLQSASNPLILDDRMIANPTEEILMENGYFLVSESPKPESSSKFYWKPIFSFDETNKVIIQNWEQVFNKDD